MLLAILLFLGAYLLGSVCSAVIVARIFNLPNPQTQGSKNPGATNILRISGKKYAMMVLVLDALKGLIPVLIAKTLGFSGATLGFVGFFAVLGHIYPIFFDFKGGKGVATALGVFLGLNVVLLFFVLLTWTIIAYISKYSSLASIIAISLSPMFTFGIDPRLFLPLAMMALLIVYMHRDNINRLRDQTESKIDIFKKK